MVAFARVGLAVPPDVLELLEPQAATASDAAIATAAAPPRAARDLSARLLVNFAFSLSMFTRVSDGSGARVLRTCERTGRAPYALGRQSVAEAEMGVDEPPSRQRLLQLHARWPTMRLHRRWAPGAAGYRLVTGM